MITLNELRKLAKEQTEEIKEVIDNTAIESSGLSPNYGCAQTVDIIFNKIIDLMSRDTKKDGFTKNIIVGTAKRIKEPIKDYIMEMKKEDAIDIVKKVKYVLKSIE